MVHLHYDNHKVYLFFLVSLLPNCVYIPLSHVKKKKRSMTVWHSGPTTHTDRLRKSSNGIAALQEKEKSPPYIEYIALYCTLICYPKYIRP